jgi:hypothetical protein
MLLHGLPGFPVFQILHRDMSGLQPSRDFLADRNDLFGRRI